MSRTLRAYYYTILGAIGGLLAWQASNLIGLSFSGNIYLSDAVVGALIGLCLGFPLGAADGFLSHSVLRGLRSGLRYGIVGMLAGAIGLPLGEIAFHMFRAGVFARALGWGLFGLMLGFAEGFAGQSEIWKGALGGALGGLLGGLVLEATLPLLGDLAYGKALGLGLLGAAIGAMIAFVVVVLSKSWLEVTEGKLRGTTFILDKFMADGAPSAIIGSSPLKSEIVLMDPDVEPQHAMLIGSGSHFTIKDMSMGGTFVGRSKVEQARLADGRVLRMGQTALVYHERR